jgi:hypothetical protein
LSVTKDLQTLLGVEADGEEGPITRKAMEAALAKGIHPVKGTSFADPADVRAFRRCKIDGHSDQECFRVGDNGIGCWGDDCSEGSGPIVAITPDDMIARFGSTLAAKHRLVQVTSVNGTVTAMVKDRMPWKKYITNGAGLDMNPDTCKALGISIPAEAGVLWVWAND